MTSFVAFFESLWKNERWPKPEPFPWQTMLAERAASGDWPEAINLPTASGKTACMDAAIFALAASAQRPIEERMPRRIWFVVDRRIVVDEAYERARIIAKGLADPGDAPVREIAKHLRALSGTKRPLAVARLRGGAWRDDGWARLPGQPAVICSTVDQVGSALLFRAYGHGDRTASIYAGLAANDSLILLDEAHCAVPFLQTLRAVAHFRSDQWAAQPLKTPFRFSVMSATPPADIQVHAIFPKAAERSAALDHPILQQRFAARKAAALTLVKDSEFVAKASIFARMFAEAEPDGVGKLVSGFKAAPWASRFAEGRSKPRVAVMVNRVATAEQIAEHLRGALSSNADIVLLTGRMRPLDRDDLVATWGSKLKAGSSETLSKPVIVVTTQCLEVGADFSFDALVTECASLDALRQRFGRLDRLGTLGESPATILIRDQDAKEPKEEDCDPIYGRAIYETWKWLNQHTQSATVDAANFGIEAMDALVNAFGERDEEHFKSLVAPTSDAPILLPAHLDLLCETSPRPTPEPDVTLFLHGKNRGTPEVRVVFRADLRDGTDRKEMQAEWLDILSLLPPTSAEMLAVPLGRFRRWLTEDQADDVSGDVEGARDASDNQREGPTRGSRVPFLLWRGRDHSRLSRNPGDLRPDDVIVLRLDGNKLHGLGQSIDQPNGTGADKLDLAERAMRQARGQVVLRLQKDVLGPWTDRPAIKNLLEVATAESDHEEIEAALQAVLDEDSATPNADAGMPALPGWLKQGIKLLRRDHFRIEDHPAGGLILIGKKQYRSPDEEDDPLADKDDPFADEDDLTSKSTQKVTLRDHTSDVSAVASDFAARCLPSELCEVLEAAARAHDLGKLDWRFQIMLRNRADEGVECEPALAKSDWLPERQRRRLEIREDVRLPEGFRHEFLSLQLAEHFGLASGDAPKRDLALHLVASHHGYARPFAPVVPDRLPEEAGLIDLSHAGLGLNGKLSAVERQAWNPAYRLDSGVSDRFWRLTRCYGWWGLAYLEAVFRLADWQASRRPGTVGATQRFVSPSPKVPAPPSNAIGLDALDGANPLAFLAALGTLRVLTRVFPEHDFRLSWDKRLGAWRPLLWATRPFDEGLLLSALHETGLKLDTMFSVELLAATETASPRNKKGEARWKDKLLFPVDALRDFCAAMTISPSVSSNFSATWAAETNPTDEDGVKIGRRTRFDFTAGQQAFIRMLRELRDTCTLADLRRALLTGWDYSPRAISMRWDTQDEKRQYALQAVDPTNGSENPPLADRGANFLAVEALPLFPLVPDRWSSQVGFRHDAEGRSWHWPIWIFPLGLDGVRSLLGLELYDLELWPPTHRLELGVAALFQSGIVQPSGRYRCFTPAQSL